MNCRCSFLFYSLVSSCGMGYLYFSGETPYFFLNAAERWAADEKFSFFAKWLTFRGILYIFHLLSYGRGEISLFSPFLFFLVCYTVFSKTSMPEGGTSNP